jgi:hypothetical protein
VLWVYDFTPCIVQAVDVAGTVVGEYRGRVLHPAGVLEWAGRARALRPDSLWRDRYVLLEDDRRLATIEGRAWGKRPINIRVDGAADIGPGLLLFAVYVVGALQRNVRAAPLGRLERPARARKVVRLLPSSPRR